MNKITYDYEKMAELLEQAAEEMIKTVDLSSIKDIENSAVIVWFSEPFSIEITIGYVRHWAGTFDTCIWFALFDESESEMIIEQDSIDLSFENIHQAAKLFASNCAEFFSDTEE